MADFSDIVINTTAQRIETMANMDINSAGIDENSNDFSLPTSKAVFDFVSANGGGGSAPSGDFVAKSDVLSVVSGANYEEIEKPVNTQAVINYLSDGWVIPIMGVDSNFLSQLNYATGNQYVAVDRIYYVVNRADPTQAVTLKQKLDEVDASIGDMDAVLDELHNYAQALIGGEA